MKRKWIYLLLPLFIAFTSCQSSNKTAEQHSGLMNEPQSIASDTQNKTGQENNITSKPEKDILGSQNNATQQSNPFPQNSSDHSNAVKPPEPSDAPKQVQNPAEIPLSHEQVSQPDHNNLMDFVQINTIADSMRKAEDDNSIILSVANQLWKCFKHNDMLLDVKVADINDDLQDEIIFLYRDVSDPGNKSILSMIHREEGKLTEFGVPKVFDTFFTQLTISDLFKDSTPEVCVTDDGWEYPEYMVFSLEGNDWKGIDLYSLGVEGIHQFVDFSADSISIGHRVTTGVFGSSTYQWDGTRFVEIGSNFYDGRKLYKLDYQPVTDYDDITPEHTGDKVVVSDVYELISVLGSDRTIRLEPGVYDFDKIRDPINNPHVSWSVEGDGYYRGLKVQDVRNLAIEAAEEGTVEIATLDEESVVICFENSENVTLKNLIMGHGVEAYNGECSAEVLQFNSCRNIIIHTCTLYGCGAYGFTAQNCAGLKLMDSVIEECGSGAAIVQLSENIEMDHCILTDNEGHTLLDFTSSNNLRIADTLINNNHFAYFIRHNSPTIELTNINCRDNNFSEDMQYNGEPDSPERWKAMAEPVFLQNSIPLISVSLENEYDRLYPVFSVKLKEDLIYDQQASFREIMQQIAEEIDYSSYYVNDDELQISIEVRCDQERRKIYEIIYLDTEEYQNNSLLSKENLIPMAELAGIQIPITVIPPDEIEQFGKPLSYDIAYSGHHYLNLEAVYPGNRIIRQPTGYYRKWFEPDRAFCIQLPEAFSNNLLQYNNDNGLILIDKQNSIIAFLQGTWGAWCQFTLQYAYRLSQGSLRDVRSIGSYREGNNDIIVLNDKNKIYKFNLQTLETVEKSLSDWTILPNAPSMNHCSYSTACLQLNRETGTVRKYFPQDDYWKPLEIKIPQSFRMNKMSESAIITNNGNQYGILLLKPDGSQLFIEKDDEGKLFGKEIIDLQFISWPGPTGVHTEPMVLFADFSYKIFEVVKK